MLHRLAVGQLYHPRRTRWPEVGEYNYRAGAHELRLFWASPSKNEIRGVRKGKPQFALLWQPPVVWFLYHFSSGGCPWSDAPYSIHLVPEAERVPPEPQTGAQRSLLQVVLIDADTGIVQALRAVTFAPLFSQRLARVIQEQWEQPFARAAYAAAIQTTYAQYSETEALLHAPGVMRSR